MAAIRKAGPAVRKPVPAMRKAVPATRKPEPAVRKPEQANMRFIHMREHVVQISNMISEKEEKTM